uniref:Uncharacterized protein n=1 Tax=Arundo donax TaxID=35708 RepID=A0A0A9EUK6_ARUDO
MDLLDMSCCWILRCIWGPRSIAIASWISLSTIPSSEKLALLYPSRVSSLASLPPSLASRHLPPPRRRRSIPCPEPQFDPAAARSGIR